MVIVDTENQIEQYLESQPEAKRGELEKLHQLFQQASPGCRLWFADGRDAQGKVVANPSIGYGAYTIHYADGTNREFYRVGLSANKTGISVYVLGLEDKSFLAKTFGKAIGKGSVSGYCIRFKTIADLDVDVLLRAVRYGFEAPKS